MNNILNSTGSYNASHMPFLHVSMQEEEELISTEGDHNTQQLQLCSVYNRSSNLINSSSFNYPPNQQYFDLSYPQVASNNQVLPPQNCTSQYQVQLPLLPDNDYSNQLGLELGYRTFYPSRESSWALAQFFRSRGHYYGFGNQPPRCQVEGCKVDLTSAKRYHRRHKVCEFHSKAAVVHLGGIMQRFCQQCSR